MNTITGKYSLSDRQKLSKAFKDQVSSQQNHNANHPHDGLQKIVVNGQYHWVKQSEIFKEEERRKRFATSVKPIRALRDGENSLVSLIEKTLFAINQKTLEYEKEGYLSPVEKNDTQNIIHTIQTRTNSFAEELSEIENTIELTKSQNQVFIDAERVFYQLSQLKNMGKMEQAQLLFNQNSELIQSYQFQRKSLQPLIDSANYQRTNLQREYYRCLRSLWLLLEVACHKNDNFIIHEIEQLVHEHSVNEINAEYQKAKQTTVDIEERKDSLCNEVPSNVTIDKDESSKWDKILPSFSHLNEEFEFMVEILYKITKKIKSITENKSTSPSKGMVYSNQ